MSNPSSDSRYFGKYSSSRSTLVVPDQA